MLYTGVEPSISDRLKVNGKVESEATVSPVQAGELDEDVEAGEWRAREVLDNFP